MNKRINIAKYNASGNDFVIFHTFLRDDYSKLAIALCDRINAIGADGLVVVFPTCREDADFEWDFYNKDGSLASMCGNASRAVSHYAYMNNLVSSKNMKFISEAGLIQTQIFEKNEVEVILPLHKEVRPSFELNKMIFWIVDTGVPHVVGICKDLSVFNIALARSLRKTYDANVNFVKVENNNLYIRTYERGVEDETLACGTGMSASFLWCLHNNLVSNSVIAYPKSNQPIGLKYINERVYMRGSVSFGFATSVNV